MSDDPFGIGEALKALGCLAFVAVCIFGVICFLLGKYT